MGARRHAVRVCRLVALVAGRIRVLAIHTFVETCTRVSTASAFLMQLGFRLRHAKQPVEVQQMRSLYRQSHTIEDTFDPLRCISPQI